MKKIFFPSQIYQIVILISVVCGMLASQFFVYCLYSGYLNYYPKAISFGPYLINSQWIHYYLIFILGAYLGASSLWFIIHDDKSFRPILVACGATIGLMAGHGISQVFMPAGQISGYLNIVQRMIIFLAALTGGNISAAVHLRRPQTRRGIFISFITGFFILTAPLILSFKSVGENSEERSISRLANKESIKGIHQKAVKYIEDADIISATLGRPLSVRSKGKVIMRITDDGLRGGELLYRITGAKGDGGAVIEYTVKSDGRWLLNGVFSSNGDEYPLPEIIYYQAQTNKN